MAGDDGWDELLDQHEARLEVYRGLLAEDADLLDLLGRLTALTLAPPAVGGTVLVAEQADRLARLTEESRDVARALRARWPGLAQP